MNRLRRRLDVRARRGTGGLIADGPHCGTGEHEIELVGVVPVVGIGDPGVEEEEPESLRVRPGDRAVGPQQLGGGR